MIAIPDYKTSRGRIISNRVILDPSDPIISEMLVIARKRGFQLVAIYPGVGMTADIVSGRFKVYINKDDVDVFRITKIINI